MVFYKPMLAKEAPNPFTGKDWIFEVKWDGFRAIAYVREPFSLKSRNGRELIHNFPEVIELVQLARDVVVDGEIVILRGGKVDFERCRRGVSWLILLRLIERCGCLRRLLWFLIFWRDGKPLVDLPLLERKRILRESVRDGDHVVVSDFVEGQGEEYFKVVSEKGLEGVVAKRKTSRYEQGLRTGSWLKIKNLKSCDCVIFGYTRGVRGRGLRLLDRWFLEFIMLTISRFMWETSARVLIKRCLKAFLRILFFSFCFYAKLNSK